MQIINKRINSKQIDVDVKIFGKIYNYHENPTPYHHPKFKENQNEYILNNIKKHIKTWGIN